LASWSDQTTKSIFQKINHWVKFFLKNFSFFVGGMGEAFSKKIEPLDKKPQGTNFE
jgi:hypothetical protein